MRNREVVQSLPVDLSTDLDQPFYSPAEVARLAGLHPSTILSYIHAGRLYAIKLSERTYRIPNKAVLKLLAPELATPPVIIERPYAKVDPSEADREPEWPWPAE
jgi:excisionase family DNA binding protein